jgi:cell division protein FtsQ
MKKRRALLRKRNVKREDLKRRSRVFFRLFLFLALIGGIWGGGRYALTHLRFFSIAHLTVQGDPKTLSPEEVIRRSEVAMGDNLFAADIQGIQAKLKIHPYFKTVRVQRRLPNTLVIGVQEYFPEFILSTGRLYYVDRDGEIFKDVTETTDSRDFPVLTGIAEEMILEDAAGIKNVLKDAAELKRIYQQSALFASLGLSEIHYEKNIGFNLYPEKKKYSIKVGLKDFEEKLSKLTDHWEKIDQSKAGISSIDLNYPGKILMTL